MKKSYISNILKFDTIRGRIRFYVVLVVFFVFQASLHRCFSFFNANILLNLQKHRLQKTFIKIKIQ